VEKFCDEVLWLDAGRIRGEGDPRRVVSSYISEVAKAEEQQLAAADARAREAAVGAASGSLRAPTVASESADGALSPPADMFQAAEGRWGTREVEITAVELLDGSGAHRQVFNSGEPAAIRLSVRALKPMKDFAFGVGIFNAEGVCVYGTNTNIEDYKPAHLEGEAKVTFRIDSLDLVEGTYKLDLAAHSINGAPYDYHRSLYTFRVKSRVKDVGLHRPRHTWEFKGAALSIEKVDEGEGRDR
jgi:hypothetical protein